MSVSSLWDRGVFFFSRACRSQADFITRLVPAALFGLVLLSLSPSGGAAHTNSVGYIAAGNGSFTIWYGTYHVNVPFTEGSLKFVGPSFASTVAFTLLTTTKPKGLVDGQNNF